MTRLGLILLVACGSTSAAPSSTSTPVSVAPTTEPAAEPSCTVDVESLLACDEDDSRADAEVARRHAEAGAIAYANRDYERCALELSLAVDADPRASSAPRNASAALECLVGARDEGPISTRPLEDESVGEVRDRDLDAVARRAFCLAEDPRGLYWMGRVRHDVGRFTESVPLFDAVVRRATDDELGTYAVDMALEGLVRLVRSRGTLCRDAMDQALHDYRRLICVDSAEGRRARTCVHLIESACYTRRRSAEREAEAGQLSRASVIFEELASDSDCNTEVGDMLLFNAARCAEQAGDDARARSLRARLARDHPQSPFLQR